MVSASSRRRSQPATSMASSGAPMPMTMAPAVMSWPACGIDTCSDRLMSLSVPGTAMTPEPMTKLPAISAHSAREGKGGAAGVGDGGMAR